MWKIDADSADYCRVAPVPQWMVVVIHHVLPFVEASRALVMRLRDLSQDTSSNGCVAWYNGRYENDYAQTREVVAVQTAKTALLRMRHLVECAEQCQRASADDNLSAGFQRCHLIVDEADHGDQWMLLLLAAGKILHEKG